MLRQGTGRWSALLIAAPFACYATTHSERHADCCDSLVEHDATEAGTEDGHPDFLEAFPDLVDAAPDGAADEPADGAGEAGEAAPDSGLDRTPDVGPDVAPDGTSTDNGLADSDVSEGVSEADAARDVEAAEWCGPFWEPDGWELPPYVGEPCVPTICPCHQWLSPEDCHDACGWFIPGERPPVYPDYCACPTSDAWRPCYHDGDCDACCMPVFSRCVRDDGLPGGECSPDYYRGGCCCVEHAPGEVWVICV